MKKRKIADTGFKNVGERIFGEKMVALIVFFLSVVNF